MDLSALTDEVEAVSELYAFRHGFTRDERWLLLKLHEELGELTQAFLAREGQARAKGRDAAALERAYRDELADTLAQVLLLARHTGVDLEAELLRKWSPWKDAPRIRLAPGEDA